MRSDPATHVESVSMVRIAGTSSGSSYLDVTALSRGDWVFIPISATQSRKSTRYSDGGFWRHRSDMSRPILLSVEDDDAEFHIIQMALEESGVPVQVCRVADGEQGILFLQRTHGYESAPRPNLILLNVNLPKKDGFEVLSHIRSTESLRSIPVVMFTSSSLLKERNKALALGAEDFISKPRTLDGLIAALSSVCSRFLVET